MGQVASEVHYTMARPQPSSLILQESFEQISHFDKSISTGVYNYKRLQQFTGNSKASCSNHTPTANKSFFFCAGSARILASLKISRICCYFFVKAVSYGEKWPQNSLVFFLFLSPVQRS